MFGMEVTLENRDERCNFVKSLGFYLVDFVSHDLISNNLFLLIGNIFFILIGKKIISPS